MNKKDFYEKDIIKRREAELETIKNSCFCENFCPRFKRQEDCGVCP